MSPFTESRSSKVGVGEAAGAVRDRGAAVVEVPCCRGGVDRDVLGPQVVQVGAGAGRWCQKSPWLCGQVCSQFHCPVPPPLLDLAMERPEVDLMTLLLLAGSWSVTLSASQTCV